jgi:hypothetical protein
MKYNESTCFKPCAASYTANQAEKTKMIGLTPSLCHALFLPFIRIVCT